MDYEIIPIAENEIYEDTEAVKIRVLGKDYIIRADQDPQSVASEIIANQQNEQVIP